MTEGFVYLNDKPLWMLLSLIFFPLRSLEANEVVTSLESYEIPERGVSFVEE